MLPDPWLDEDTVTAGLRPSTLPDRAQLLNLILSAVPSTSTSGIVVVGERGSGKSHLLLSIKEGLPKSVDVRTFTGKPERRALHFGALGAVSAAEADEAVPPGLHVLRALTSTLGPADYLYTPPRGRRRSKRHVQPSRPQLVLLVDDIHYIDPASLAVLLQLIPGFGATLVATAESRHPLPPDLYQLWEDGFLEQFFLPPFTFNEAHALCESILGGHVQRRASSLLAAMSGFNVGLLCLAVDDARSSGFLVRIDGYWTIDVRAHCDWPGVAEHVRKENTSRPPEERQALELIALSEPVALEVVERHFGRKAVEHLLANNDIRLLPGQPPLLRTSSWLRGEGTRLSVPQSRSVALRLGVEEPGLTTETAPAMLRWITWTLDCGLTLSYELLLAAAPAADSPSTAELALRAASAVTGADHVDEARLVRARALIAEGHIREAGPELRQLATAGGPSEVKIDAAHRLLALGLLGAATLATESAPLETDPTGLDPAGQGSAGQGSAGQGDPSGQGSAGQGDPAVLIVEEVREAERLLLSGAAPEALQRSSAAIEAINADPTLDMFLSGALLRHVIGLRYNLAWEVLDPLLDTPADYTMPMHLSACLDVARGYVQLSQGLPRAARATLEPVLAELHDAGLPPVRALAAALLAYSEALCGNSRRAMARARQSEAAQAGPVTQASLVRQPGLVTQPDLLTELSTVFVAAARDQASGTPRHLMALAEHLHSQGSMLMEAEVFSLLTLNAASAAVDDSRIQRRLGGLAATVQGPGGAALGTFAAALLDDDPKTFEAAGRSLSADRQFAHAALCYSRAATGYEARTRVAASRRASVLLERLRSAFDSGIVPPPGWVPGRAGG
ncbi:ATP-binding protein [Arthrobacter sp. ISL-95]|uniref:ATP-binding protein n=1 Tax=Arthrobacter sp. ISL-95 TaxID=2819116 RepID=UPI001BE68E66|nr:ATP-binding protein [Arthrobacter sp. ISL-95]MBT2584664.1 AAA family ATPase [Arthrobacter sp. ISL-95]